MANIRYRGQRDRVPVPHVSLGAARRMARLTLDQVCEQFAEITGRELTRGALSAIENGHRGASAQVIAGLEKVFDLSAGEIDTKYEPRERPAPKSAA